MSSESDSSVEEEQMQSLRDAAVPLKGVYSDKSEKTKDNAVSSTSTILPKIKIDKPSLRKKIYGDENDGSEYDILNVAADTKRRIAKSLDQSIDSELEEGKKFSLKAEEDAAADSAGIRLFKKSRSTVSSEIVTSQITNNQKRSKRKVSSSDDSDDSTMANLASVAVTADFITQNSLTKYQSNTEIQTKAEKIGSENTDNNVAVKKKKKSKKREKTDIT